MEHILKDPHEAVHIGLHSSLLSPRRGPQTKLPRKKRPFQNGDAKNQGRIMEKLQSIKECLQKESPRIYSD